VNGNIAIIPARRGSKGVPGKNLRRVGGLSLVEYAIGAAKAAEGLRTIAVTSDDPNVLQQAVDHGVLAIKRPDGISEDASPVTLAVRHALECAEQATGGSYEAIVLLQPTAPLRRGSDVVSALKLFYEHGRAVCSVSRCEDNHPARMYRLDSQVRMHPLNPQLARARRQDLPPVFIRNGAIYVFSPEQLRRGDIITDTMTAYIMSPENSVNIDTEYDIRYLEFTLSANPWKFL
jgi:CMP-N,N'-diacetyllegionaminic acid synthase